MAFNSPWHFEADTLKAVPPLLIAEGPFNDGQLSVNDGLLFVIDLFELLGFPGRSSSGRPLQLKPHLAQMRNITDHAEVGSQYVMILIAGTFSKDPHFLATLRKSIEQDVSRCINISARELKKRISPRAASPTVNDTHPTPPTASCTIG